MDHISQVGSRVFKLEAAGCTQLQTFSLVLFLQHGVLLHGSTLANVQQSTLMPDPARLSALTALPHGSANCSNRELGLPS